MKGLQERKHLLLLLLLILTIMSQGLAHVHLAGLILFDALASLTLLTVFFIIFERRIERQVSLALVLTALGCNWASYGLAAEIQMIARVIYHSLMVVFLDFAVVVILRELFRQQRLRADHIFGAFCGYLIAGIAWANLYMLTEYFFPGAFKVNPEIAWQLGPEHLRRFLYTYFSLVTLTSLGYGDITPVQPGACSLVWLEAVFGQFYVAVIVAQLIGLKLAQAMNHDNGGAS